MTANGFLQCVVYFVVLIGLAKPLGAYMARAGEDILFVDRVAEHVDAINATGLRISGFDQMQVAAKACRPEQLREPLGLVFLAVKSQDTPGALEVIAPLAMWG